VLTTLKAKGAFPENHPLSVGVRGSLAEHFLQQGGRPVLDRVEPVPEPVQPRRAGADKKTIVQCTVDTLDINRSYETRHAVIGTPS
jgi:thiamine pyrophosphate-dependent acetolactate synthase large subunit-like protein